MICALVPPNVALVHLAPYLLRQRGTARDEAYLLGVLSSIPLDWYARRFVEQHMTYEHLNAFPIPRVCASTGRLLDRVGDHIGADLDHRPLRDRVVELAGRLAAVDHSYSGWAAEVGVLVNSVTPEEEAVLTAELDALVCLLYGLDAEQVASLFASFHRGWDYGPRLAAVQSYYATWRSRLSNA
jgi:hypothetical protein